MFKIYFQYFYFISSSILNKRSSLDISSTGGVVHAQQWTSFVLDDDGGDDDIHE